MTILLRSFCCNRAHRKVTEELVLAAFSRLEALGDASSPFKPGTVADAAFEVRLLYYLHLNIDNPHGLNEQRAFIILLKKKKKTRNVK